MASLTHKVLNWQEDQITNLDCTEKHAGAKAFGLGMVEGFIDSATIIGLFVIVGGLINAFTKKDK